MKFSELNLHSKVLSGIKKSGFTVCMPVQEKSLPITLSGSDVMVQSKTGSGKTAVFVITFLERYLKASEDKKDYKALIIAPTRELAQQIADDASKLASHIKSLTIGCFTGGVGYEKQLNALKKDCSLIVGTPGRILEFLNEGKIKASSIDLFVIDEADRLFDMGFFPDVRRMFRMFRPCTERQTMLFSATLEMRVRELAWEYMNNPEEIEFESDTITVDKIDQRLYHVAKSEKFMLLLQLLASEQVDSALLFTNSRSMTMELAKRLQLNGYSADYISGDLTQKAREKALANMKNGKTKLLVATDVAARGLQIDDLPLVINYDIPEDYENYVHRIGRTARAGKSGKAITLADEEFVYGLEAIENYIKMKIPVVWPDNLPVVKDLSRGVSFSAKQKGTQGKKNQTHQKKNKTNKTTNKTSKELSSMSQEERMKYYAEKYGFEEKKTAKRTEKPKTKPNSRKGFFSRLFSTGKK